MHLRCPFSDEDELPDFAGIWLLPADPDRRPPPEAQQTEINRHVAVVTEYDTGTTYVFPRLGLQLDAVNGRGGDPVDAVVSSIRPAP